MCKTEKRLWSCHKEKEVSDTSTEKLLQGWGDSVKKLRLGAPGASVFHAEEAQLVLSDPHLLPPPWRVRGPRGGQQAPCGGGTPRPSFAGEGRFAVLELDSGSRRGALWR